MCKGAVFVLHHRNSENGEANCNIFENNLVLYKKKACCNFQSNWFCSKTFCGTLFKEFKCTTDFYSDSSEFQKEQNHFWAAIAALFNYHYPINDVRNSIRLELALIYYRWIKAIKT